MTGPDPDLIRKRIKLVSDAIEEERAVASRQIGATDPTRKENVATEEVRGGWFVKADAIRRMPRDIQDGEPETPQLQRARFVDETVGRGSFEFQVEPESLQHAGVLQHGFSFGMTEKRAALIAFDGSSVEDMIEMRVCQPERFQFNLLISQPVRGSLRRVDHDGFVATPHQITIGVEDTAYKSLDLHVAHSTRKLRPACHPHLLYRNPCMKVDDLFNRELIPPNHASGSSASLSQDL